MTNIRKITWVILGIFIMIVIFSVIVSNFSEIYFSPPQFNSLDEYFTYAQGNQYTQNSLTENQLDNLLQEELVRQNYDPSTINIYSSFSLSQWLEVARGTNEGRSIISSLSEEDSILALSALNNILLNLPSDLIFASPYPNRRHADFWKIRNLRIAPQRPIQCSPNPDDSNYFEPECLPAEPCTNPLACENPPRKMACECDYGPDGMGPPNCRIIITPCEIGQACLNGQCIDDARYPTRIL